MTEKRGKNGKGRRHRRALPIVAAAVIVIVLGCLGFAVYKERFMPTKETVDYSEFYGLEGDDELLLVCDSELCDARGMLVDGEAYIPYEAVCDYINARFYWDDTEDILRYVTEEGIISTTAESDQWKLDGEAQSFDSVIAVRGKDQIYLSVDFVGRFTDIRYEYYENPGRLVISDSFDGVVYTEVGRNTQLREKGGIKSPVIAELEKGSFVSVIEKMDTWAKVCTQDGFIGYMQIKALSSEREFDYEHTFEGTEHSHISADHEIYLAWHQTANQSANGYVSEMLESADGVNVISPTWFYLNDDEGGIASLAGSDYVSYCHERGIEVWGLVSNFENADVDTHAVLSVTSSRDRLVENLIEQARRYDLDGINVDFESLSADTGSDFLEFIRELSLKCGEYAICLSVDNYFPESYNEFYDLEEQAAFADYIILMGYDEHYSGSEAGSVASLSWVKSGVEESLKQVPAGQLILGIPFYTRLWTLDASDSSGTPSQVLGMSDAEKWVDEHDVTLTWQDDSGQYYGESTYDGTRYGIWMEEIDSIGEKLAVESENGLAGAAFWKLGYEKSEVWSLLGQ